MNKIREKLQRFMIGRYGMDQLGQFIMYTVLVLIFLNVVVRVRIFQENQIPFHGGPEIPHL